MSRAWDEHGAAATEVDQVTDAATSTERCPSNSYRRLEARNAVGFYSTSFSKTVASMQKEPFVVDTADQFLRRIETFQSILNYFKPY